MKAEESVERLKASTLRVRGRLAQKPADPSAAKRFEAGQGAAAPMPDAGEPAVADRVAKKPEREPPGGAKPPATPPVPGGTHVDRLLEARRKRKDGA